MGYLRIKGVSFIAMCFWTCCVIVIESEAIDLGEKNDLEWMETPEQLDLEIIPEDVENVAENPQTERESSTLRCHRRIYKTRVEQQDDEGRKCWDTLSLEACWGRCDSHEISEWKFPYKKSKHPVCGFGARKSTTVQLQYCEDGAGPEARIYHHVRPITCRCRTCTSTDTSCGWLPLPMH